mmetsp:Transcript_26612/g.100140  ORF Transcript_26612/g.100140 Transcript_26612/m.100140 type:complete len:219 (+) Transcript_26612:576-1232(+)
MSAPRRSASLTMRLFPFWHATCSSVLPTSSRVSMSTADAPVCLAASSASSASNRPLRVYENICSSSACCLARASVAALERRSALITSFCVRDGLGGPVTPGGSPRIVGSASSAPVPACVPESGSSRLPMSLTSSVVRRRFPADQGSKPTAAQSSMICRGATTPSTRALLLLDACGMYSACWEAVTGVSDLAMKPLPMRGRVAERTAEPPDTPAAACVR